jgi:hypothetical protein
MEQVVELRRYLIKEDAREHFARYFETYFPEAFQQIGAIAFGQFLERKDPARFTWMRGFRSLEDRAKLNAAFYDGPVWKEHAARMNDLMIDSDNVLLLRPLSPERAIPILPAVDVVKDRARGAVVAHLFPVKTGQVAAFAAQAEATFARHRAAGLREAGLLVTLDVPNNFPRHPIRSDGPWVVWLGIVKDDRMLESLPPFPATDLLRGAAELVILDPTARSRLRWSD